MRRIGVDTGGTFTDCVLWDDEAGRSFQAKVPSLPANPERAVLAGISELLASADLDATRIDAVVHGTTIATNAVIEGKFARTGFIGTRGCRDVLEIGSQQRLRLYDLHHPSKPLLITRDLRREVPGRLDASGAEIEAIDSEAVRIATRQLQNEVEAIAVGGLFSFVNPDHERHVARIVAQQAPNVYVVCSSDVSREGREYPRFSTAAINAALAPRLDPYIRELERVLRAAGFRCPLFVMQSNGGVVTARRSIGRNAHNLILSGPAAGVIGGVAVGRRSGFRNLVPLDVGGTSADIGIAADGRPRSRVAMTLSNGLPLHVANLEVDTIGAGGGSIAWVDAGGALQVGPQSAGADPGPACFGKGGVDPTITDAQLVLGRLNPGGLLGGSMDLDHDAAVGALNRLARQLRLGVEAMALGIVSVMEANMAGAIQRAAARHGYDLREFSLVAAGGAGGLSAAALAKLLGMPVAIIPPYPGLLSASGLLTAELRHDLAVPLPLTQSLRVNQIECAQRALQVEALLTLAVDGISAELSSCEHGLEVRYVGQEYSLTVPVTLGESADAIVNRFHSLHEQGYGHAAPDEPIEVVAARVVGIGAIGGSQPAPAVGVSRGGGPRQRPAWFQEAGGYVPTSIYQRHEIASGFHIVGPAIIEQLDSTTVVPPGHWAQADAHGCLILREAPLP